MKTILGFFRGQGYLLFGLFFVLFYWASIKPPGSQRGYVEDFGHDTMTRQIMADQIREHGRPYFYTRHYGIPDGISVAYSSWTIEGSWFGGVVWNWSPEVPFLWLYFGFSLLFTYFTVGLILLKMELPIQVAWIFSAFLCVFNIPRHLVTWNRMQILYLHWVYAVFFLDALIWQMFTRHRRFSWTLELWRIFGAIGVFGTFGYFWGPTILEWVIVRSCMIGFVVIGWSKKAVKIKIEGSLSESILPSFLILLFLGCYSQWFIPLRSEALSVGDVTNGLGYFGPINLIFSPLWIDGFISYFFHIFSITAVHWRSIVFPETPVTVGWFYWIPVFLGLYTIRKKSRGPGWVAVLPFIVLLVIAVWYTGIQPKYLQYLIQAVIPFMGFFRVMSRWGVFFPIIAGVLFALSWKDFLPWMGTQLYRPSRKKIFLMALFVFTSILEMNWIFRPVHVSPELSQSTQSILNEIQKEPGSTVLDMPFCLIGGNGVCHDQCPAYPLSTVGAFFRGWHKKDVYGAYLSRLVEPQCQVYQVDPFQSWFAAWREHRCFSASDWKLTCNYLKHHPELSAVLVYPEMIQPDIPQGGGAENCLADFRRHLGPEKGVGEFFTAATLGGAGANPIHIYWFKPMCLD